MDNSEPVAKRRGTQTHSCWSADSSFPPKPPPPTGGCRAQYDGPQSAYLPAQGTGHPTLVGFSSEGDSPRKSGGVSPQIPDKNIPSGQGRPLKPPLPNRAQRNRVGFDTLDFFGWFGSASVEASCSRCPPQIVPSTGGGGYTVPPHLGRPATWCQCPRARGHHTCNFFPY